MRVVEIKMTIVEGQEVQMKSDTGHNKESKVGWNRVKEREENLAQRWKKSLPRHNEESKVGWNRVKGREEEEDLVRQ